MKQQSSSSDVQGRKLQPQLTNSFLLWPVDKKVAHLPCNWQSFDKKCLRSGGATKTNVAFKVHKSQFRDLWTMDRFLLGHVWEVYVSSWFIIIVTHIMPFHSETGSSFPASHFIIAGVFSDHLSSWMSESKLRSWKLLVCCQVCNCTSFSISCVSLPLSDHGHTNTDEYTYRGTQT